MNYKAARDLSWKIFLKHKISSLPIDVKAICRAEKINVFTYKQGENFIKNLGLEEHMVGNDAFSIRNTIFYDDTTIPQRQRFSIAHEIGHIFLHLDGGARATVYNREPQANDDPIEVEANLFAARLLAPLCVIQFLNLNSAKEIAEYCDISYSSALLRFNRLCEIRKRSSERRKTKNHGTFLISKLEREVVENFKEYIEKNKKVEENKKTEENKA
jgi:Zn-dependent peptidase ImmA (M78 family)